MIELALSQIGYDLASRVRERDLLKVGNDALGNEYSRYDRGEIHHCLRIASNEDGVDEILHEPGTERCAPGYATHEQERERVLPRVLAAVLLHQAKYQVLARFRLLILHSTPRRASIGRLVPRRRQCAQASG